MTEAQVRTPWREFLRNFRMVINQSANQIAFSRTTGATTKATTSPSK